jgi:hypothetical protein
MTAMQLFGIVFALGMIYITYFYYKRKIFLYYDVLLWAYVWMLLIIAVIFPEKLSAIIQPLQIVRVLDLLTMGSIFLLFSLVFVIFARSRYNDRRIEKIVKEIALKEKEK